MRITKFLFILLVALGVAFSLSYFGPGTAMDCTGANITISVPDTYLWNQAGAGRMDFQTGAWGKSCIFVETDDVIIDCSIPSGRGIINGSTNTDALIWVNEGLDNVTIQNCHLENTINGAGIFLGGSTNALVSNMHVENNYFRNNMYGTDTYNITDSEFVGNEVEDALDVGFRVDEYSNILFEGNEIHGNCAAGRGASFGAFDVLGSELYIYNNTIYDLQGYDGIAIWGMENGEVMDNVLYDLSRAGLACTDVRDAVFSGNLIHDIGLESDNYAAMYIKPYIGWGIYPERVRVIDNVIYNGNGTGLSVRWLTDGEVSRNTVYGTVPGKQIEGLTLDSVNASNVTNNEIYGNEDGLIMEGAENAELSGNRIYGNSNTGIYLYDSFWMPCSGVSLDGDRVYENGGNAVLLENCAGAQFTDVMVYRNSDSHFASLNSTVDAVNFWIGADETYGIMYGGITVNADSDLSGTNLILDEEFISLDSSDANAAEFNVPANLTTHVGGCSNMIYYNDSADVLPGSAAQIRANGTEFTPAYSACGGTRGTYQVEGFSGYTALGEAADTGGGSSLESLSMGVSGEKFVGEEITITVKSGSAAVNGAEVSVRVKVAGIYHYYDLGKTNSSGEVFFTPEYAGTHKAMAEKSGHYDDEIFFSVAEAERECTLDGDCATGFECVSGECEQVEEAIEETPAEEEAPPEQPEPECVQDSDCASGEMCEGGNCIEKSEEIEEAPPVEEPEIVEAGMEVGAEAPAAGEQTVSEEEEPCSLWVLLVIIVVLGIIGYWYFSKKKNES